MNTKIEYKIEILKPKPKSSLQSMSRRDLLKRSAIIGGSFVVGSGFLAHSSASWALEVKALTPEVMATLLQMARDVYPHDSFGDELYAVAIKGHDDKAADDAEFKTLIEDGVAKLDSTAQDNGHPSYLEMGWEADRTNILKSMESSPFFQTIRGGLVVGLYNQEAVWELLGYEGSSFDKGGYIGRGFDDINWL